VSAARSGLHLPTVLGIAGAVLAQALDSKVLTPVLPLIRGDFALSPDDGNWIVIIYLMFNFALLPLSPWVVERFGRRLVILTSLGGFIAGALLSALAVNFSMLVVARALQGACGAGLISTCHAALRGSFPDSHVGRGQVAFIGSFVGAPLVLGPFIGGLLYDNQWSWRWTFIIEAAIGLAALALCRQLLTDWKPLEAASKLDVAGALLLALSLAPLQYILYQGDRFGWWDDPGICALSALSAAALVGFIAWERRLSEAPLIDLRMLGRRPIEAVGAALMLPVGVCLAASIALIVGFVQQLLGFTATMAGELVVIRAVALIPFAFLTGAIMDRRRPSPQILVPLGLFLLATASVVQAYTTTTGADFSTLIVSLIVGGVAIGPTIVPLLWVIFQAIPRTSIETLRVATVVDLMLQLGTVVATATIATAIDERFSFHYDALRSTETLSRLQVIALPPHVNASTLLAGLLTQQSYALAFADGALIIGMIAVVAFPLALFLRPRPNDLPRAALER
jgi:MFS transporter, DHA2 family, multidrug resistance protein